MADRKDEKPVTFGEIHKRSKKSSERVCIIHHYGYEDICVKPLTNSTKNKIIDCYTARKINETEQSSFKRAIKNFPPELNNFSHGFHRRCYQRFTNLRDVRKRHHDNSYMPSCEVGPCGDASPPKMAKWEEKENAWPKKSVKYCILCNVTNKKKRRSNTSDRLVLCENQTSIDAIVQSAQHKDSDVLQRIEDACNSDTPVYYHETCRQGRIRRDERHQNRNKEIGEKKNANRQAFDFIKKHVEDVIIHGCQVERIVMLRNRYCDFMKNHFPQHHNPNYRCSKLKKKLKAEFGDKIVFWTPSSPHGSELVFSTVLPTGPAIEQAYISASSDSRKLDDAAMLLRKLLTEECNARKRSEWPPSANDLISDDMQPPERLMAFLRILLSGNKKSSQKKERVANSIAQDICYCLSNGELKTRKHVLLAMTVRHLTGNHLLLSILNHFGHCLSLSLALELETAVCLEILEKEALLPPNINTADNVVVHFAWDNFDLREETSSGAGTTHSTHGIVVQESRSECPAPNKQQEKKERTRQRSVVYRPLELPPCCCKANCEPQLLVVDTTLTSPASFEAGQLSDFSWIVQRSLHSTDQSVPGWAGWVAENENESGDISHQTSRIEYMKPVLHPATQNDTVQHVLDVSLRASQEAGQDVTIVTFDLAIAKKAYNIVWQSALFATVFIRLGAFHLLCAYMSAIGKMMRGSGFDDVIVQSGVCSSGSIEGVLSGKHYNRALKVHKAVLEALERLLLDKLIATSQEANHLMQLLQDTPDDSNQLIERLLRIYIGFKADIRAGVYGGTARFWLVYMEKVWTMLQLLRATKTNDLDLHVWCLEAICPVFFACDHVNYARYATIYFLSLVNLNHNNPEAGNLLRKGGFSVSRSRVNACRQPVDQTIECSINKHAKSKGGLIGMSQNAGAYMRWCLTRHVRASLLNATFSMAGLVDEDEDATDHKESTFAQRMLSEDRVKKIVSAFNEFVDPFTIDETGLYSLSSGVLAPPEVAHDLLNVDAIGQDAFRTFIQERLVEKTQSFYAPLKRKNLKTFATIRTKKNVSSSEKKVLQISAQRNLFGHLLVLSVQHDISLQRIMEFEMSPIPWSLATADGLPVRCDKSKLMKHLEPAETDQPPSQDRCTSVIDGMAFIHTLTNLPSTFGELCQKIMSLLPRCKRVDFVMDVYKEDSIKQSERQARGQSDEFLLRGPATKIPSDWNGFLKNDKNKTKLTRLLVSEWQKDQNANQLNGKEIFITCAEKCVRLTSSDGKVVTADEIDELASSQEEADSRLIVHCFHQANANLSRNNILVRSTDTDVFLLLLHFTFHIIKNIFMDVGTGNHRRIINMTALAASIGQSRCEALLGFHAFSGCDSTSSFVRKKKLSALRTFYKHIQFENAFMRLGTGQLTDTTIADLEHFVCCMYGKPNIKSVNSTRYHLVMERLTVKTGTQIVDKTSAADLSLIPPCQSSLQLHIKRAHHQVMIWKAANVAFPLLPCPAGNGWIRDAGTGKLAIQWCAPDILPTELVDVLCSGPNPHLEDEQDDGDQDVEAMSMCDAVEEDGCHDTDEDEDN